MLVVQTKFQLFESDRATKLNKALPIITTAHAAAVLIQKDFTLPLALTTWEPLTVMKGDVQLRITAMPGKHGPGLLNALLPCVMGSMLEFIAPSEKTTYRMAIPLFMSN